MNCRDKSQVEASTRPRSFKVEMHESFYQADQEWYRAKRRLLYLVLGDS
jgi:hypothetical protein